MIRRRYYPSEYLTECIVEDGESTASDLPSEQGDQSVITFDTNVFTEKTLIGRNEHTKRVVELSAADIEDMTGIPFAEMFGTDETGEKVAYIGAPWQALTVMDANRMFVFDYEYGEIANFSRSYGEVMDQVGSSLDGQYSFALRDYYDVCQNVEFHNDPEAEWVRESKIQVEEVYGLLQNLDYDGHDEKSIIQINKLLSDLEDSLQIREIKYGTTIERREVERVEKGGEHGEYHPIEGYSVYLRRFIQKVHDGLDDVYDYEKTVAPNLERFIHELPDYLDEEKKALAIKFEELSMLNMLRLEKKTEKSHVIVGIFPDLPLKQASMDRLVCSYSISTHVIPEADEADFRSWIEEIDRVLTPGGKAYIFPMQQRFPFGREYDEVALDQVLGEHLPVNGGRLEYAYFENPDTSAWRQDTTLIIEKISS